MDNRQLFLNPVQHALRIYQRTKEPRRKFHILASLIKYYSQIKKNDLALQLFQETLPKAKAIRSAKDRNDILFYEMFFLAKELHLIEHAKGIIRELERKARTLKQGSRERKDIYDHVAWGYAVIGNFSKAIAIALKEARGGTALSFIAEELLKAKRDSKAISLLESIRKMPPPAFATREEKLLDKIFGTCASIKYEMMLQSMIETYSAMGKINKAESLIHKLDRVDDKIRMYVTIAHSERERGKKSRALKYLNKGNKLREKRASPLPSDISRVAREHYGGIEEQLLLAKEYALLGKKSNALSIASDFLVLAKIKAHKKSIGYFWLIEKLAIIYELCGKRVAALRIAKAGDLNEYQERKIFALYSKKIKSRQFKSAYVLLKKITHKWKRIRALDLALDFCAQKQIIYK